MARTKGASDLQPRKKAEPGNRPCDSSPVFQKAHELPASIPDEYNARMIQFIMDITPAEILDRSDPVRMVETMENRFTRYLQKCAEYGMKVGNQGAYTAIGITKNDVWDWTNRPSTNPLIAEFVKKVQKLCALYREQLMQDGKINPATGIFWQKNYDGLKDQQEVVLTPNNPLGDSPDAESMKKRYLENTYGIAEGEEVPKIAEVAESAESTQTDE